MKPAPKMDIREVADIKALELGILNPEDITHNTLQLIGSRDASQRDMQGELADAFSEWITGPEKFKYNGIQPSASEEDRQKLIDHWKAYAIGDKVNLEERSNLADHNQIPGHLKQEAESLGEWIADTYEIRGDHRRKSLHKHLNGIQLESNLGLLDRQEETLRIPKTHEASEKDVIDSALRVLETEADEAQIIEQGDQVETRTINSDVAEQIIGNNTEELLEQVSDFYNSILEDSAQEVRETTGLEFNNLGSYEYLEVLKNSDINKGYSFDQKLPEYLKQGIKTKKNYKQAKKHAAEKLSDESGIIIPFSVSADEFLENVDGVEMEAVDVEDIVREKTIEKAEKISDIRQLSGNAFETVRDLEEGEVYRDTDENGKRIYRWSGGSSYSVTTIINPLPTSHKEIDTGGGLFYWKNKYDGSKGRYDADTIKRYSGIRGTLAHEEVFSKYVEDESEVRNGTEESYEQLRGIKPGEGEGLGEIQDILDWKDTEDDKILAYSKNDERYVQNGRDLAEKEIKWIKEQFTDLEDDLGLTEDNVIYAEQEFALTTVHPWDEDDETEGPEIGDFSYGGTTDLIYQNPTTGETVLLDLKTGSMKPNYTIQQAAYKHAVENSNHFDDPRLDEGIDRVVIPEIDPETMMYTDKEPIIHTDQPHPNENYKTSKFLDASNLNLETSEYRKNRWRPENWHEEALYVFARATDEMPAT